VKKNLFIILEVAFCVVKPWFSGVRTNANTCDMSTVLPENIEEEVKQQAEISMGSEISEEDILNITHLCDQVHLIVLHCSSSRLLTYSLVSACHSSHFTFLTLTDCGVNLIR